MSSRCSITEQRCTHLLLHHKPFSHSSHHVFTSSYWHGCCPHKPQTDTSATATHTHISALTDFQPEQPDYCEWSERAGDVTIRYHTHSQNVRYTHNTKTHASSSSCSRPAYAGFVCRPKCVGMSVSVCVCVRVYMYLYLSVSLCLEQ